MFCARHFDSWLPLNELTGTPLTLMAPPVGVSSPPIRLRSVVLPEPDGPISARKSPFGISRLTPLRTSMRSLPRVKCLWMSRTRTRVSDMGLWLLGTSRTLLDGDLAAIFQIGRRRHDDALARAQSAAHFHAIAVGAARLHGAPLHVIAGDHERVARAAFALQRRLGDEGHGLHLRGRPFVL